MRILGTIFVVLIAVAVGVLAWMYTDPKYRSYFVSEESTEVGSSLYGFQPGDVAEVEVRNNEGVHAVFKFENNRWVASKPWKDRATNIAPIITFTIGMVIQEVVTQDEAKPENFGLGKDAHHITIRNKAGVVLADYRLGLKSSWIVKGEDKEKLIPSVYVQRNKDDEPVYLCTDPQLQTHALFENKLLGLRDYVLFHRFDVPFLSKVCLKKKDSTIEIEREVPPAFTKYKTAKQTQWQIKKPLEARADLKQVAGFINTLSSLTASDIKKSSEVVLPESDEDAIEIELHYYRRDKPVTLVIYPSTTKLNKTLATVSDRPNAVFEIPHLPTVNNKLTYATLPKNVNDLRARDILSLNQALVNTVVLKVPNKAPVRLTKFDRWYLVDSQNEKHLANENALEKFILALTQNNIIQFVSDAPTDIAQYGLDEPRLTVHLVDKRSNPQVIKLGKPIQYKDPVSGVQRLAYFAKSVGEETVWLVDSKVLLDMKTNDWEWLPLDILDVSIATVRNLKIEKKNKPTQFVKYDFAHGTMVVREGDKPKAEENPEVTYLIDPNRLNFMLRGLLQMKAQRRIDPNYREAQRALLEPLLRYTLSYEDPYTFEMKSRVLSIAASGSARTSQFFYLHDSQTDAIFMIDRKTIVNIASPIRYEQ